MASTATRPWRVASCGRLGPVLLLAACSSNPRAPEGGSGLTFTPCHLDGLEEEMRCATVEVFEDRVAGTGARIPLAVTVIPARRSRPEPDPLFLLAGGPGQGARSYARLVDGPFREIRKNRDVVLVDLRGTGDSGPLSCPVPEDDWSATSGLGFDAAACLAAQSANVALYNSESLVDDLDEVRARLGYERINLWGGSYGTRAALVYARRHGEHLRSVVLDGAAPFETKLPLSFLADGQRSLDQLLTDCEADTGCRAAYPDLRHRLDTLLARLKAQPTRAHLRHPRSGEPIEVVVSRDAFASAVRGLLYSATLSSLLPWMIDRAEAGDYQPFAALGSAGSSWATRTMALGLTLSVLCTEDVPRIRDEEVAGAAAGSFLGDSVVGAWRQSCAQWQVGPLPAGLEQVRPSRAPALILSGNLDPATPPRWGEAMRRHFPRSLHLVAPGVGHNVSFSGCAPKLIARFIAQGTADGLEGGCLKELSRPPFLLSPAGPGA